MKRAWITFAALVIALLIAAFGCATNPVTGRRELSLVSSDQELRIGREGYQAIVQQYGVYDDPRLQAYVDSVGQRVARNTPLHDLAWHFTVLDDPVVNAFAMPGGYIYVTRGIMAHLNSEAQLAAVLGHEIGHVNARHTARQITQQQLAGLGLGVASLFSSQLRENSQAAQTALGLLFLKFSRSDETQADELGVKYSTAAGYDPREMPATYTMLKRVSDRAGQHLPGFLSTHPDPGDRETRTTALAQQATVGKSGLLIRHDPYVARLEGVVFGDDPRQGYFDGDVFYHPELGFTLRFPSGWKKQNTRSSVMAAEPNGAAQMQLTLVDPNGASPSGYVDGLVRAGKVSSIDGRSTSIGGFEAWIGRLRIVASDGTSKTLDAGFVGKSDRQMFEFLGLSAAAGDANEDAIFSSMRTFKRLDDPPRLSVSPNRVHLVRVRESGTFGEVIARLGSAISAEEASILNNIEPDEDVRAGETIKNVERGRR